MIGCYYFDPDSTLTAEVVLVRIYGNKTDLLIDRRSEKINIAYLHQHGLAPELFATFKNGLVYEYVEGVTLNTENVKNPVIWRLVAANMARMHKLQLREEDKDKEPFLKMKFEKFLNHIPDQFSDPIKQERCS